MASSPSSPGWDMAKVRGTRYNTGDGIRMALDIGAQPHGQWSGCHLVSWERYAPDFGDLKIDTTTRVLDISDKALAGLYAAGELVGGLFYYNYPGSSGLMAGSVFGRIAGREAASYALGKQSAAA